MRIGASSVIPFLALSATFSWSFQLLTTLEVSSSLKSVCGLGSNWTHSRAKGTKLFGRALPWTCHGVISAVEPERPAAKVAIGKRCITT
jgi:hypothetical protein